MKFLRYFNTRIIVNFLIILVIFFTGWVIGYNFRAIHSNKKFNNPQSTNQSSTSINTKQNEDIFESESHYDERKDLKLVIQRDKNTYEWIIMLHDGEEIIEIGRFFNQVYNFLWTRDSQKVSFTHHEVSNHNAVYIIDIPTRTVIPTKDEQELFVRNQPDYGQAVYTYAYSYNVDWYDNNTLIVSVSGYPDVGISNPNSSFSNFYHKDQFFLIDGNTGEVFRRIL